MIPFVPETSFVKRLCCPDASAKWDPMSSDLSLIMWVINGDHVHHNMDDQW